MNKAIFWDSDGTLLYGNESFRISLMRAFNEYGYSLEEDIARSFMKRVCSWYMPEKDHSDKNGEGFLELSLYTNKTVDIFDEFYSLMSNEACFIIPTEGENKYNPDGVAVFADCAINIEPDANQIADIAISSASV